MHNFDALFALVALTAEFLFDYDALEVFGKFAFGVALVDLFRIVARHYARKFKLKHKKSPSRSAKSDGKGSHLS